jgi:hypothetical protein
MSDMSQTPDQLFGNEGVAYAENRLVLINADPILWIALWRDPVTDQLWIETYPNAELQGGGSPVFTRISLDEAKAKYGYFSSSDSTAE